MAVQFKSQEDNKNSFDVKLQGANFVLAQDVEQYIKEAKLSRDVYNHTGGSGSYRSFAIIPDIVAIDILTKYGIDVHGEDFMTDPVQVKKIKQIIKSEYPQLLTSDQTRRL